MTNRAIEQNEKTAYQLVLFSWNDGADFEAYTDWTSAITDDEGVTYSPRPTMEVKLPKNTGDLGDETLTVDMTQEDGFLTDMSNGLAHATVQVTVSEVTRPTNPTHQRTTSTTFQGTVVLGTRNVNGRKGNVRLVAKSPKALTNGVSIGTPCNIQCGNNLGGVRCKVDMGTGQNTFFGLVATISGRTVTINNLTFTNPSTKYFHRGWVIFGGLRIMIRDWSSSSPTTFVLVRQPPASWAGATVLVSSGCDKSIETCRERYDNEENFNGTGFGMPGYLPIFESA